MVNLKSKKNKPNLSNLLQMIMNIIRREKQDKSFLFLILVVTFQAFLDVLSVASVVPLIYIIQDKNSIENNLNNFLYGFFLKNSFFSENRQLILIIPLMVILIMIVATLFRIYLIYRTNKYIEDIRHNISIRLMNNYINKNLQIDKNTSEIVEPVT